MLFPSWWPALQTSDLHSRLPQLCDPIPCDKSGPVTLSVSLLHPLYWFYYSDWALTDTISLLLLPNQLFCLQFPQSLWADTFILGKVILWVADLTTWSCAKRYRQETDVPSAPILLPECICSWTGHLSSPGLSFLVGSIRVGWTIPGPESARGQRWGKRCSFAISLAWFKVALFFNDLFHPSCHFRPSQKTKMYS